MPFLLFCFLYQPNRETLVKITKTLSFLKQLVRAEQSALAQKGPSGYIPRNCSLFALESDRTKCAALWKHPSGLTPFPNGFVVPNS